MDPFQESITLSMLEEIASKTDPLSLNAWLEDISDLDDEDFVSYVSSKLFDVREGKTITMNRARKRAALKTLRLAGKKSA